MRIRERERDVYKRIERARKLVDELVTVLDAARLVIERDERGEYVLTDGRDAGREKGE